MDCCGLFGHVRARVLGELGKTYDAARLRAALAWPDSSIGHVQLYMHRPHRHGTVKKGASSYAG